MESRPTKVLLFAPRGAGDHYHGAGTTFYRMYDHAKGVFETTLVHGSKDQPQHDCYKEQVFLGQIGQTIAQQIRFISRAKRWIKAHHQEFDVLHATMGYHHSMVPSAYAVQLGLPAVITIATHGGDLGMRASRLSRLLGLPQRRRRLARQISAFAATSHDIEQELLDAGVAEGRVHRIPYGVNASKFHPIDVEAKSTLRKKMGIRELPTFVFVGELVPRKRPKLILEAMRRLRESCDGKFQTVFVGPDNNPDYVEQMKSFVADHQLDSNVVWAGFQREVAPYFQCADAFILASVVEGLPNAMLEAMASGLPVIGTLISGMKDMVVPNKNGFIIQPTVDALADAMQVLIQDTSKRESYGRASLAIAQEQFTLDVVVPKYANLFQSIAATPAWGSAANVSSADPPPQVSRESGS